MFTKYEHYFCHIFFQLSPDTSNDLKTSKWFSTTINTTSKYIPKRLRICINWNIPFQTQIYLVNVLLNWTLWNKIYFIKTVFENFIKWSLKGMILIDAYSGPLGYLLLCCGSRSWEMFPFFFRLALAILCFFFTKTNLNYTILAYIDTFGGHFSHPLSMGSVWS